MKNKFFFGVTTIGIAAMLFTGCSKLPQAEIDAANAAIEEAKTTGAELYVQDSFVALQDSMNAIMVNLQEQESKVFKNYADEVEQLSGIVTFAGEVKAQSETRKEEMKIEIQNTIAEVRTLLEVNRQLILEAPKGKEGTTVLNAMKEELNTIEAAVVEAGTMLESGEYITSHDKAHAAKEKASSINTELTEVISKYKAYRKG